MIDEFLKLVIRRCEDLPPLPVEQENNIPRHEQAAYKQGFSDALKLIAYLP